MTDFLRFLGLVVLVAGALFAAMRAAGNDYVFYAGYTVLEYVVLGCASGALRNDAGALWFKDRRIDRLPPHQRVRTGLARTFQLPRPFHEMTIAENLRVPLFFAARQGGGNEAIDEALTFVGLAARRDAMPQDLTQVGARLGSSAYSRGARHGDRHSEMVQCNEGLRVHST